MRKRFHRAWMDDKMFFYDAIGVGGEMMMKKVNNGNILLIIIPSTHWCRTMRESNC